KILTKTTEIPVMPRSQQVDVVINVSEVNVEQMNTIQE
ncbi:hypothetical protein MCGE09_00305, partial [Thaumarchaeota archaeon SCGC AB-539-E09]